MANQLLDKDAESRGKCVLLVASENLQLLKSLDEAFATTAKLREILERKEEELLAVKEKERIFLDECAVRVMTVDEDVLQAKKERDGIAQELEASKSSLGKLDNGVLDVEEQAAKLYEGEPINMQSKESGSVEFSSLGIGKYGETILQANSTIEIASHKLKSLSEASVSHKIKELSGRKEGKSEEYMLGEMNNTCLSVMVEAAKFDVIETEKVLLDCDLLGVQQTCGDLKVEIATPSIRHQRADRNLGTVIERVKFQEECIAELRGANEQLQAELQWLQLHLELSTLSVSDMLMGTSGMTIQNKEEAVEASLDVGPLNNVGRCSAVKHFKVVEQLKAEVEGLRVQMEPKVEVEALSGNYDMQSEILQEVQSPARIGTYNSTPPNMSISEVRIYEEAPSTPSCYAELEDKHICITNQDCTWAVKEIAKLVESITEELTKHLHLIVRAPFSTKGDSLTVSESRIKGWCNVSRKALQTKLAVSGAVEEWGKLALDLLCQSRCELATVHQKLLEYHAAHGVIETRCEEHVVDSKEATWLKDETDRLEARDVCETVSGEEIHARIEDTGMKSAEQDESFGWLSSQVCERVVEDRNSIPASTVEKELLKVPLETRSGESGKEREKWQQEITWREKRVEDPSSQLEHNEHEFGKLMELSGIDLDVVVAGKLRQMEEQLEDALTLQARPLQVDDGQLACQVVWLQAKLEEAELESKKHVELLSCHEDERALLAAEFESSRREFGAIVAQLEQELAEKTLQLELTSSDLYLAREELCEGNTKVKDVRALEVHLDSLQAELKTHRGHSKGADEKKQDLNDDSLVELLQKLSAMEAEVGCAKREVDHLNKVFRLTESQRSENVTQNQVIDENVGRLRERLEAREKLLRLQSDNLLSLRSANKQTTARATALEIEASGLRRQLLGYQCQVLDLEAQSTALQQALDLEGNRVVETQETCRLQAQKLAGEEEMVASLQSDLQNVQIEVTLQGEFEDAKKAEVEAQLRQELAELKEELGTVVKKEVDTRLEVEKLRSELALVKKELVEVRKEEHDARGQLERATSELAAVKQDLRETKQREQYALTEVEKGNLELAARRQGMMASEKKGKDELSQTEIQGTELAINDKDPLEVATTLSHRW